MTICSATLAVAVPLHAAPARSERELRPLSTRLTEMARQRGAELLYDDALVRGLTARRPRNNVSVETALRDMLRGTGIDFRKTADGAFVLFRRDAFPQQVQQATAIPEILVVGRRLLNVGIARSENDIQPYRVIAQEEIADAHRDNIDQFFRSRVTANADVLAPAQDVEQRPGEVRSSIDLRGLGTKRTLVLVDGRRLPAPAISIVEAAQSDLNGIPLGAIERIEVLTGTAGGIHGPNATGGVVNVIMRRDYEGAEFNVVSGISDRGDSARIRLEGRVGWTSGDGATRVMLFGAHSASDRLTAGQRDFALRARERAFANDPQAYIFRSGLSGYTPVGNSVFVLSATNGPLTFDPQYGGASLGAPFTFLPLDFEGTQEQRLAVLAANAGQVDLSLSPGASGRDRSLLNNPSIYAGIATVRHQFDGGLELFVDSLYVRSKGNAKLAYDPARGRTAADAPGHPFAQDVWLRYPADLDVPVDRDLEMFRVTGGIILDLPGAWNAEADFGFGQVSYASLIDLPDFDGSAYGAAILSGLGSADGRPPLRPLEGWDMFRTALDQYRIIQRGYQKHRTTLTDLSVRLAGPVVSLPGGPLTLTLLGEYRRDHVLEPIVESNVPDLPVPDLDRSFVTKSAYGEALIPLVAQDSGVLPLRGLELQLAVRFDALHGDFLSDFLGLTGNDRTTIDREATVFTAGARFFPLPGLMLRGSYATGLVQPDVTQLQSTEIPSFILSAGVFDPKRGGMRIGTDAPYVIRLGGSHEIEQERASTLSLGFVATPFGPGGPRLSVDWSRIHVTREIQPFFLPIDQLVAREDEFPDRVGRGPLTDADRARGYTAGPITLIDYRAGNLGASIYQAVDFRFDWSLQGVLGGELSPYASITWQPDIRTRGASSLPWTQRVGFRDGPLEWRGNGGLRWRRGNMAVDLNAQYYSGYRIVSAAAALDGSEQQWETFQGNGGRIAAQTYVDLALRRRIALRNAGPLREIELRFSIQNLFDRSPPIVARLEEIGYSGYGDPRRRRFELGISMRH